MHIKVKIIRALPVKSVYLLTLRMRYNSMKLLQKQWVKNKRTCAWNALVLTILLRSLKCWSSLKQVSALI